MMKTKFEREDRREIKTLITAREDVNLSENQYFCSTPKAYEIWDETEFPKRIYRISKTRVFWVIEND